MSHAALMERAPGRGARADEGESTLDALFAETWGELSADRTAECLVCGETMAPVYAAHARPVGGRCASCRTEVR